MSQALATTNTQQHQPRSVLVSMAERYGMEPAAFEETVRATCSPKGRDARALTKPEFAAFLLVSKEYRLNPLTKEIYAFPAKGGGIVPVVSVDGWISLVNTHPQCDGFEFKFVEDDKGVPVSCTCTMYRKDRGRPVIVTEYLAECIRDTDPWKMKHRMLRHKALIQTARYAFGFSGIYDEDEARDIVEGHAVEVTPRRRSSPPAPPALAAPANDVTEHQNTKAAPPPPAAEVQDAGAITEPPRDDPASDPSPAEDAEFTETGDEQAESPDETLAALEHKLSFAKTVEEVEEFYTDFDPEPTLAEVEDGVKRARIIKVQALGRVQEALQAAARAGQATTPAKGEVPPADSPAPSSDDPFAVPEGFLDAQEFRMCIQVAVGNVVDKDSAEKLVALWRAVKPLGADVPVTDATIREMQALVTSTASKHLPKKEREPKAAEPEAESKPEPAPVDLDATPTTIAEYEAQLAARAALVTDWPSAHAVKTWFLKSAGVREAIGLTAAAVGKDYGAVIERVKKPMEQKLAQYRQAEG